MNRYCTLDEIKNIAAETAKKYGVEKISLFGSFARGEQKPDSDIDFIINKGKIKGLLQFNKFIKELEESLNTHVDVITYKALENSLIKDAVLDEVVLYEQ